MLLFAVIPRAQNTPRAGAHATLLALESNAASPVARGFGSSFAGAASAAMGRAVVPLSFNGRLAILDAATGELEVPRIPVRDPAYTLPSPCECIRIGGTFCSG
ncbi:MAG: hypothetical protein ACKV22_40205 [Bryobacteraceae bacterium]